MSQKASGYERISGDRYYTPAWCIDALLQVESFVGIVYDPCAGAGNIIDALRAADIDALGFDIEPDGPEVGGPIDFTTHDAPMPNAITNPPYGKQGRLAVTFIEKALALTWGSRGKVAMLLRVDFDSANGRRPIFEDHPAFSAKYTLTRRIRWTNLPQTAAGPTENHAWFVWNWARRPGEARYYGYLPLKGGK